MGRQYLAFDIETARKIPGPDFNWRAHRPLGIVCAAALSSESSTPIIFHGRTPTAQPAARMSQQEVRDLVRWLVANIAAGFTLLTWNGLGFDLDVLAEESGMLAECRQLAMNHVDMMFHVFCGRGFPVGLEKSAQALRIPGKPAGISGILAPQLWAQGKHQQVIDYVAQHVCITLQVAQLCEKQRSFAWLTQKGSVSRMPLPQGWLAVHAAMKLPKPDTSWMSNPIPRSDFTPWLGNKPPAAPSNAPPPRPQVNPTRIIYPTIIHHFAISLVPLSLSGTMTEGQKPALAGAFHGQTAQSLPETSSVGHTTVEMITRSGRNTNSGELFVPEPEDGLFAPPSLNPDLVRSFDSPLPQTTLDIDDKTRANVFAWRGQFSPQLVESLLSAYCPEGARILDPFSGSGTSLLESARLGRSATAVEINPAGWLLTRVYTLCNVAPREREAAIYSLADQITQIWRNGTLGDAERRLKEMASTEGANGIVAGAYVILLDLFTNKLTREHCERTFTKITRSIRQLPLSSKPLKAVRGDARAMPLPDSSVDFVLTSPPYINVFNYHQHYRRSAEILGYDLLLTARSEIGSNRANRANRFLTVIQYCLDMAATFRELYRVCTDKARVLFVVGHESNVLGVPFRNAEFIASIAAETGAFRLVLSQVRWYTNRFGTRIREDLMHFEPRKEQPANWEVVARLVAERGLLNGLSIVSENNRSALQDAIERIGAIHGIPTLKTNE